MVEFSHNLWAPWRVEYFRALSKNECGQPVCFLCEYAAHPDQDNEHLVIYRTTSSMVLMNLYPYTNGHLMVAPLQHVGSMKDMSEQELLELNTLARDAMRILDEVVKAQGYNVGMNLGRCAGAGLPDHIHSHIVPRWNGDTNFMTAIGDARVIGDSLDKLYLDLREAWRKIGLM